MELSPKQHIILLKEGFTSNDVFDLKMGRANRTIETGARLALAPKKNFEGNTVNSIAASVGILFAAEKATEHLLNTDHLPDIHNVSFNFSPNANDSLHVGPLGHAAPSIGDIVDGGQIAAVVPMQGDTISYFVEPLNIQVSPISFMGPVQGIMPDWMTGQLDRVRVAVGLDDPAAVDAVSRAALESGMFIPPVGDIHSFFLDGHNPHNDSRPDLVHDGKMIVFPSQLTQAGADRFRQIFGMDPQPGVEYWFMATGEVGNGWHTVWQSDEKLSIQLLQNGVGENEGWWVVATNPQENRPGGYARVMKVSGTDQVGSIALANGKNGELPVVSWNLNFDSNPDTIAKAKSHARLVKPVVEGTGISTLTISPETLAPIATPEATVTPEPTVIQQEVTFNLIDGTTLPLTCFLKNTPQTTDKEILESVLKYFVDLGVDWGNGNYIIKGSEDSSDFARRINLIPGKENVGGWFPVRPSGAAFEDFFGLLAMKVPYEDKDFSLIVAKVPDKNFPRKYVCADINPEMVQNLIVNQLIDIPRKPVN